MKGHNRKFYSGSLNHCYQNTRNGYLLFYTVFDCLVFFTVFCSTARRYNVSVLKLCLMPDHIHFVIMAESRKELYSFVRDFTKLFAKLQNEFYGRKGALFNSPFGSAPKKDLKQIKANLIYVDNNPVERDLAEKAEDYQWNFIAYAHCSTPFSEPLDDKTLSDKLKASMSLASERQRSNRPLNYSTLRYMFKGLDTKEQNQLIDHIITCFSIIDHSEAIRFFGSYENMLTADHSTTGSEYDIKEQFVGKRDDVYAQLTRILLQEYKYSSIQAILKLTDDERFKLFQSLSGRTSATPKQIAKYLRLPLIIENRLC